MSRQLVESIIDKDFVLAESHFNDRLSAIMEKKLYEKKRMVATQMDEMLGGMSRAAAEKKYRERGQEPRKASDVYGDPRDINLGGSEVSSKPKSQQMVRKLAAKVIKVGRKVGGSQFRKGYLSGKKSAAADTPKDDWSTNIAGEQPSHSAPSSEKKLSSLRQNWNTLRGRKPNYVKPETPEDEKGGNVGKVVRKGAIVGGKVAKAALSLF